MKWFRWYRGTSENPKFSLVARRANRPSEIGYGDRVCGAVSLTDVLAVWITVLEDASNDDHWGTCAKDAEFISAVLQWGAEEVGSVLTEMVKIGLLEQQNNGWFCVVKWEEYQYSSDKDPTNAMRQRRYYNRQKTGAKRTPNALAKRPETETETDKKERISRKEREHEWPKDFEQAFWREYPLRVGKHAAVKKLRAIHKSDKVDWPPFIAAVKAYAKAMLGKEPQYISHPTTWLSKGRWEDELPGSEPQPATNGHIHVMRESPDWPTYAARWLEEKGKEPPIDKTGGWWFPSPVSHETGAKP